MKPPQDYTPSALEKSEGNGHARTPLAAPETTIPPVSRAEILDRLYDVALDPVRLEDLLDAWENHSAPMRARGTVLDDPEMEAHMRRAEVFITRFETAREEAAATEALAASPRLAAFLSAGDGRISACNAPATEVFGIRDGCAFDLLPFQDEDLVQLAAEIRRIASGRSGSVVTLRVRSTRTGSAVLLGISRVVGDRPLALVRSTELAWPEGFDAVVQEAFALTPAEVQIVHAISLGQPVRDIAVARGRSAETVRSQLRSILQKTETHSQSELVRVVLGLMELSPRPGSLNRTPSPTGMTQAGISDPLPLPDGIEAAIGTAPGQGRQMSGTLAGYPALPDFQAMSGPDQRRLTWREFGDPAGQPVLFMHMDYGLVRWPASAEWAARARGLRVIVPVRAGYGATDLHGPGVDHIAGVTRDHATLLDQLGVQGAVAIPMGADLRFALALANRRPDLVRAVLGCACQLPLRTAAQYERMDKWQRVVLANARYAPRVLPFIARAAFSLAKHLGKDRFMLQLNGGSPADIEVLSRPEAREAVLRGTDVCLGPGISAHEGFAREAISSERDWSGLIHDARVPVRLLQGDQDPQTPIENIQELMGYFPNLSIRFLENSGQLLFFQHWPLVLDELAVILGKPAVQPRGRGQ